MEVLMRRLCLAFAVWTILFAWANSADAQTPADVPAREDPPSLAEPYSAIFSGLPPVAVPCDPCWTADLLLGFPTGVRVQHTLGDDLGRNWLVEGFAGLELIFPIAGAGVRRRFTPCCGERNALVVSPGVDFYVLYNTFHDAGGWFSGGPSTFEVVTGDIEVFWQHVLSDRCSSNLGIKLGAGYAGNSGGRAVIVPVVALSFGFRF